MNVNVLLFATLKDIVGHDRVMVEVPGETTTVSAVLQALVERYPALHPNLPTAVAAVNKEFAERDDPVQPGDEVAVFPPVSGGSAADDQPEIFRLAYEPLDVDDLIAGITTPATGAVCVFSGMVRGETRQRDGIQQTTRLEYEAYEPMALAKMQQVAREIREQYPLVQGIAIVQRLGALAVGQNTILIACSAGHRDQGCFEAARYGIDRLKEIVPIWKKEVRPTEAAWVEGTYQPDAADREGK